MDNNIFSSNEQVKYEVQAQIKEGKSIVGYIVSKENNTFDMAEIVTNQKFKSLVKQGMIRNLTLDSQDRLSIDKQAVDNGLKELTLAFAAVPEDVRNSPEFNEIRKLYDRMRHVTVSDLTGSYTIKKSHILLINKGYLAGCCGGLIKFNGCAYTSIMLLGKPGDITTMHRLLTSLGKVIGGDKVNMLDRDSFPPNIAAGIIELDTVLPLMKEADLKVQFNENRLDIRNGVIADLLGAIFNSQELCSKELTEEDIKVYMRKINAFNRAVAPK